MKRKTTLDYLFPLALFTVFVICFALLLSISIGSYRSIRMDENEMSDRSIALAYVSNKIRSHDEGGITLASIDDTQVLALEEIIDEKHYQTLIYYYDNALYEMYIEKGSEVHLNAGSKIVELKAFTIKKEDKKIVMIAQDEYNQSEAMIALRSERRWLEDEVH